MDLSQLPVEIITDVILPYLPLKYLYLVREKFPDSFLELITLRPKEALDAGISFNDENLIIKCLDVLPIDSDLVLYAYQHMSLFLLRSIAERDIDLITDFEDCSYYTDDESSEDLRIPVEYTFNDALVDDFEFLQLCIPYLSTRREYSLLASRVMSVYKSRGLDVMYKFFRDLDRCGIQINPRDLLLAPMFCIYGSASCIVQYILECDISRPLLLAIFSFDGIITEDILRDLAKEMPNNIYDLQYEYIIEQLRNSDVRKETLLLCDRLGLS